MYYIMALKELSRVRREEHVRQKEGKKENKMQYIHTCRRKRKKKKKRKSFSKITAQKLGLRVAVR